MEDGGLLRSAHHLWLVLLLATLFTSHQISVHCLCPAKCRCRDEALLASCSQAGLEFVPIQLNPDLQEIDLRGNRINNVNYTLAFYTNLKKFDVSVNRIVSLGARNFETQAELVFLNVSFNQISNLGKDTFRGLKQLQYLDLSHNNISLINAGAFRDTIKLETIDFSYNSIVSFTDPSVFKYLSSLKILHLHHNEILDIPSILIKNLPSPCVLETLTLSYNLIEVIEEKAFPSPCSHKLKILTLASNVIKDIDKSSFNTLNDLISIDLSFNNLTFIPTMQLSKLSRLKELDLSGNRFTEIKPVAFQSLFQLRVLKMSKLSHLQRIDTRAFVDNIRLESIFMEENEGLTRIPPRIFHGNPELLHVSLRSNSLITADVSHFPLDKLRSLDLSGNPFHCNCSLYWLWKLVQMERRVTEATPSPPGSNETTSTSQTQVQLRLTITDLKCHSPESLSGLALADVSESNVICETTWMTVAVVTVLVLTLFGATCVALLLFSTDRKICGCRRSLKSEGNHSSSTDPRRLGPGLYQTNGHQPILMLMPEDRFRDEMVGFEDAKIIEPWMNPPTTDQAGNGCGSVDSKRLKKPHIVYV